MTVRLGIHYSGQSPEGDWEQLYRAILEQAREAEELGYEVLSVAEHHFLPDGWIPAPTVFLGGLAAVTERIELVTNIVILPLHHPVKVAERAAVLDLTLLCRAVESPYSKAVDEEFEGCADEIH